MGAVAFDSRGVDVGAALVRARQLELVADLDFARALRAAARASMKQVEIAHLVGVSQSAVSQALKAAEKTPEVKEGFSGASVIEVCRRYAAGLLDRAQVVRELVDWPYVDGGEFDEFGDYSGPIEGTVDDVVTAAGLGLIGSDVYGEVLAGLKAREGAGE